MPSWGAKLAFDDVVSAVCQARPSAPPEPSSSAHAEMLLRKGKMRQSATYEGPVHYDHIIQHRTTQYGNVTKEGALYSPRQYGHFAYSDATLYGRFTEEEARYHPRHYGPFTYHDAT